jgi:hypothetical protein
VRGDGDWTTGGDGSGGRGGPWACRAWWEWTDRTRVASGSSCSHLLVFFSVRSRTSLAPGRLAAGGPGHLTVFFSVDRNWNLKDVRECWGIGFKTRKKLDGIEIDEFGKKRKLQTKIHVTAQNLINLINLFSIDLEHHCLLIQNSCACLNIVAI